MPRTDQLIDMYAKAKGMHTEYYDFAQNVLADFRAKPSLEDGVDAIYVIRKCSEYLEDAAKEATKVSTMLQRIVCAIKAEDMDLDSVYGELASGKPTVSFIASIPDFKTHPEECRTIMAGMGVPEELYATGAVRPYWPAFVEMISDKIASGLPLPDGIKGDKTYPKYTVITRAKSGKNLDALAAERSENDG